jgi:two-component system osmolarity sensor histidine kinase EnvZ
LRQHAPQSLFARTALLIAGTLVAFSLIVWQAVMWAVVVPTADLTADILMVRASEALASHRAGNALPEGSKLTVGYPIDDIPRFRFLAYSVYLQRLRVALQTRLRASQVVIAHARAPAELWLKTPDTGDAWLVLSLRLARPQAPLAVAAVLIITALLVLGVSAWSARRLTKPLARLAADAVQIALTKPVLVDTSSGPSEVRSLAVAFQSMSHRLNELNEQRELLLAGISHDLRSPLARLRVAVELIDERDADLMRQMAVEIEEMDRMIGQFLHYVRSGYRETPVQAVLDEIVRDTLAPLSGDARVQCQYAAPEPCYLSVELVRHITLNLVQNALEHGQGPVEVATSATTDSVQLVVRDAGAGVSELDWPEALRPFSRLRAKPGGGHAGLGLALVDRLVRAGRGVLSAAQVEGGFQVSVTLPISLPATDHGPSGERVAG